MSTPQAKPNPYHFLTKVPNQLGYLVISMEGAVHMSSGDLENKDSFATVITKMVQVASAQQLGAKEAFNRMTICYDDHFYTVSISGKKIFVVKRPFPIENLPARSDIV